MVYDSKILNDIYKMMFNRHFFARFLAGYDFESLVALKAFQ